MSLLQTVSPDAATGEVAEAYAWLSRAWGRVPNAFTLMSPSPFLLKQQVEYIGRFASHASLTPPLLACIRMLVSCQTRCDYCIDVNAGLLINMMGWTPEQVAAAQADPAAANLPERERALLAFVLKVTREPLAVAAADLDALRALGWSDAEILEAANYGARMVAADLLLNAFKVEPEQWG
ncbi:MAG: hypothetical protein HGA75_03760 [Thiobacillus sp.]|nr:hypothetical protein [Thiobacillus sp.]